MKVNVKAGVRVRRRGTIVTYFLVMVSMLTTGLLVTMSLTGGVQSQIAGMTLKRDQAFYAAEAGVQRAYFLLQQNNNWRADAGAPLTGSVGGASYSVTAVGDWNAPILITSTGTSGAAGETGASMRVTAACSPAVIVPAISLGNNFDNNGNVIINGDVQAKGAIRTSGRLRMAGSLYAGSTITTNGSVDISGAASPNTPNITIPVVDIAWLQAHATKTVNVPSGGNKTYAVDTINLGEGGIVVFTGSVQFKGNVNITGTGTVVVLGDADIHSAASFGSSSSPANANIVTTGKLDINGYLGLLGSIYAGGTITKNGGFDVTGVIVGQMDLDTSGGMNITRAQPPSWDPRSGAVGGAMVLSRVTGPIF